MAFKYEPTLCSLLTKVKDPHPAEKQLNVYKVPCTCGMVYIGETKRRLETRLKEHKEVWTKNLSDRSAIANTPRRMTTQSTGLVRSFYDEQVGPWS